MARKRKQFTEQRMHRGSDRLLAMLERESRRDLGAAMTLLGGMTAVVASMLVEAENPEHRDLRETDPERWIEVVAATLRHHTELWAVAVTQGVPAAAQAKLH
jgi:hypothetical protein